MPVGRVGPGQQRVYAHEGREDMPVIHQFLAGIGDDVGLGLDRRIPVQSWFPCLILSPLPGVAPSLGHPVVDRYLEVVAARFRPNTIRAVASDLNAFFAVVDCDPLEVTTADQPGTLGHPEIRCTSIPP